MTVDAGRRPSGAGPLTSSSAGRHEGRHGSGGRLSRGRRTPARLAVLRLYTRLTRRGTSVMVLVLAGYAALELASYRSAYPNGVSPVQFRMFEDNPGVRMMNGVPNALDSAGGFAVWDAGWFMQLIVAVWALLMTSRLLRGEEDLERSDLVLAGPVRASTATGIVLAVMTGAAMLIGAAVALTMGLGGESWRGSLLFGLGLAGVGATFAGVAAVATQLVEIRRRVAGVSSVVLGVAYLLRIVGNSTDSRSWVRWTTPLGWVDELQPFGAGILGPVVPLVLVPAVLAVLAVRLRSGRDTGAALLAPESTRPSHLRLLTSPLAFAWRSNRAVLAAWTIGLAVVGAVMGALVSTMVDWLAGDEGYQELLAALGLADALSIQGFLALIAIMFGLAVALQVVWRIGAARVEEESGRLEALLARPVTRLRWLGGHLLLTALGGILLAVVLGAGMWLGAGWAGSTEVTLTDALRAGLNILPVVTLLGGLAVATYGVAPRLTVVAPIGIAVAGFILYLLGPALDWPGWVLDLSPFTHLAMVPAQEWAAPAGLVMTGLGLALTAVGMLAFTRRDLASG